MAVKHLGVSGLGSIGSRHARLLSEMAGVEVHGFDAHGAPDNRSGDELGVASLTSSFDQLLDRAPDGVIIATPDHVHAEQAMTAMSRGVPVLIEKPLTNDAATARSVAEMAKRLHVPAMVGYVLRHHTTMQRCKQLIDGGAIGNPVSVHASLSAHETLLVARNRFDDEATFRLVYDYSHEWDYLQWFFGDVVRCAALSAVAPGVHPTQTPNVVEAILEFRCGVTGTAHVDYVATGTRRCRVVGDTGVIEVDVATGGIVVNRSGEPEALEFVREDRDAAFTRQLHHFIEVAAGNVEPVVSLDDGVRAIVVADALVAACTERRWVDIV